MRHDHVETIIIKHIIALHSNVMAKERGWLTLRIYQNYFYCCAYYDLDCPSIESINAKVVLALDKSNNLSINKIDSRNSYFSCVIASNSLYSIDLI